MDLEIDFDNICDDISFAKIMEPIDTVLDEFDRELEVFPRTKIRRHIGGRSWRMSNGLFLIDVSNDLRLCLMLFLMVVSNEWPPHV